MNRRKTANHLQLKRNSRKFRTNMFFSTFIVILLLSKHDASFLQENIANIEKGKFLQRLFLDVDFIDPEKIPRYVVFLGRKEELQDSRPQLEYFPHYVGDGSSYLNSLPELAGHTRVILLLASINREYIKETFEHLPKKHSCSVIVLLTAAAAKRDFMMILEIAWNENNENVVLAHLTGDVVTFYGTGSSEDCNLEVNVINVWIADKGFQRKTGFLYKNDGKVDMNGCPVRVTTLQLEPVMQVKENKDGTLQILGGTEGKLILTIAGHLNFTPIVRSALLKDWYQLTQNGSMIGLVGEIASGVATIGIGQIRPTVGRSQVVDFTRGYNQECIAWTVPLITEWNQNLAFSEFGPSTWTIIAVFVILTTIYGFTVRKMDGNSSLDHEFTTSAFNVISISLGIPIVFTTRSEFLSVKLYFVLYIFYTMIIVVAYKTALASILTVNQQQPLIKDEKGIIDADLRSGGMKSFVSILQEQIGEGEFTSELISRYEVIDTVYDAISRLSVQKDIAYLRHKSTMIYMQRALMRAGEESIYYTLDECLVSYSAAIITQRGSILVEKINRIISRLSEFGLLVHWNEEDWDKVLLMTVDKRKPLSMYQLKSAFVLYWIGMVSASFYYVLVVICYKLSVHLRT